MTHDAIIIQFCPTETLLKYVVHDVTNTEYRAQKWQHTGLSWGDFQTRSVITYSLSFMFGEQPKNTTKIVILLSILNFNLQKDIYF